MAWDRRYFFFPFFNKKVPWVAPWDWPAFLLGLAGALSASLSVSLSIFWSACPRTRNQAVLRVVSKFLSEACTSKVVGWKTARVRVASLPLKGFQQLCCFSSCRWRGRRPAALLFMGQLGVSCFSSSWGCCPNTAPFWSSTQHLDLRSLTVWRNLWKFEALNSWPLFV